MDTIDTLSARYLAGEINAEQFHTACEALPRAVAPAASAPTGTLFPGCPLPGCKNLTNDPRQPCPECLAMFGDRLRPTGSVTLLEEEAAAVFAERDRAVLDVLAARRDIAPLPEPAPGPEVAWKQGQRCWVCEQRRKCRQDPTQPGAGRWICRDCLALPA